MYVKSTTKHLCNDIFSTYARMSSKTKENLSPQNIVSDLIASYSAAIPYGSIVSASIPFILNKTIPIVKNWYSKRKRGL